MYLTVNLLTVNKYHLYNLLHMVITGYHNKKKCSLFYFRTTFTDFIDDVAHIQNARMVYLSE